MYLYHELVVQWMNSTDDKKNFNVPFFYRRWNFTPKKSPPSSKNQSRSYENPLSLQSFSKLWIYVWQKRRQNIMMRMCKTLISFYKEKKAARSKHSRFYEEFIRDMKGIKACGECVCISDEKCRRSKNINNYFSG